MNPEEIKHQIEEWWLDAARAEVEAVAPKAAEYGAQDLVEMGHTAASILGQDDLSDSEATEFAIYWYLLGKVARWTAAWRAGRRVSSDTIHDIAVYARMSQFNRAHGGWPYGKEDSK